MEADCLSCGDVPTYDIYILQIQLHVIKMHILCIELIEPENISKTTHM